MKKIAIEEHFWPVEYVEYLRARKDYPRLETIKDEQGRKLEVMAFTADFRPLFGAELWAKLTITPERISEMERDGIDMQVLCLASGLDPFETSEGNRLSKIINDGLSKIIQKNPKRFSGFATLGPRDPAAAAIELERSVKELGLKGTKLNSHVGANEYLDEKKFWPIFAAAEKLDVPVYVHPTMPSADLAKAFAAYPMLNGSLWGYGVDAGVAAMRLICSGIFDKYPGLKIILGHMGEAFPFWLWRLDNRWEKEKVTAYPQGRNLKRKPSEYFQDNFLLTTSGMFSPQALLCAHLTVGSENILFAVDYPYESSRDAAKFMDEAPVSQQDKENICHLNAERILRL